MKSNYAAAPRDLPVALTFVCVLLIGLGVISFAAGLVRDPFTAWRAFHVNFLFFGAMSLGALCLACAFVIIDTQWTGPVRHVAEALGSWVPISFVLFLVGNLLGREYIHTNWLHGAPPGKESWLTFTRVYFTDAVVLGVGAVLALVFVRTSFRPALAGAAQSATRAQGMFARWTANWRGDEQEWRASRARLRVLAPIICLWYAFAHSLIAFDQVMALNPTWFSNIFGWYFLWGGFLSGVSATALACVLLRATTPGWDVEITSDRMHDLGKMIFAFSIFWMYLFFAQYIVIWYGNLPEETQFFQARLGPQFLQDSWKVVDWSLFDLPYVKLCLVAWAGVWVTPFWVLLGERPKRTPVILGSVAVASLLGFWLERNALVWPSLVPANGSAWAGPTQFGVALGFLGAYVLNFLIFTRVFPTLPLPKRS
ncbi:MAG: hypothetical protein E6J87_14635 [Deltaproteobacteria bacterium]|nr:MAG: hypothetical protein E6J87_14635 [Deltaproteobacteria bacterium]